MKIVSWLKRQVASSVKVYPFVSDSKFHAQFARKGNILVIGYNPSISAAQRDLALCHEFVHLKQSLSGDLVITYDGAQTRYVWRGEDLTHLPYASRPWEIEARQGALELYNTYLYDY